MNTMQEMLRNIEKLEKIEKMYINKFGGSEQLEMYQKIVEHMAESVWIGDENERTIYANPNFCKLLGYSLEEMIGRESYDFRDNTSTEVVKVNNKYRKKGEASKYEGNLKAKDGTVIPVFCSGTPIPGGGTVGIMTDMREVRTLQKAKEELKELNKMKDEFISIVGHELRTPLTIIKGYLTMVIEGDLGNITEKIEYPLSQSLQATNSLIGIVNNMLDLSKIETGKMVYLDKKTDLLDLSKKLYTDLTLITVEKKISFEFISKGEFSSPFVYIDPDKYKQVIINLINNALKFTNEGGKILFIIEDRNETMVIKIQDSGIGMEQEQIEKIFQKFYQVESALSRNACGLGLGLSIIDGIIRHYNSQICIESEVGKGTTFSFSLKKIK